MTGYNNEDIIRYADGEMDATEAARFEATMQQDPALAAALRHYREVKAILAQRLPPDAQLDALKATLKQQRSRYFNTPSKVVSIRKYLIGAAAAAAILIAVLVIRHSPEKDFLQQYSTTMEVSAERGNNNDTLLLRAASLFNHKAYTQAVSLLDSCLQTDSTNAQALYYRGLAGIYTTSPAQGIADLEKTFAGESVFKYDAAFYLAVHYAQRHQTDSAASWINKIPAEAAAYEKAQTLKKQLK
ncbi:hypothetical protein SAMN05444266_1106 [Chitinophaga jiangningensis]|uniref:Tetratricopeptide repeat-containing protein n=1 Tax=Chitinophaga jiangningensis TaxID=1419482 RepID=A0A1M7KV74_9BACT|nr:hypothetical protein [Chitinophaga jiangningensis]SHM68944.1 hypothetical protein SAMN05444266_1106 [Chitinophaga jiangningensis]